MKTQTWFWIIGIGAAVIAGIYFLNKEAKTRGMNSAQLLSATTKGIIKPVTRTTEYSTDLLL